MFANYYCNFHTLALVLYFNMWFWQAVMYSMVNLVPFNVRGGVPGLRGGTPGMPDSERTFTPPAGCVCPCSLKGISYDLQEETRIPPVTYRTLATGRQRHRAAFQALAEGSRMILVTVGNWDYVFAMAKEWRPIHVYREAKRKTTNFVAFMVCEQMLQL